MSSKITSQPKSCPQERKKQQGMKSEGARLGAEIL